MSGKLFFIDILSTALKEINSKEIHLHFIFPQLAINTTFEKPLSPIRHIFSTVTIFNPKTPFHYLLSTFTSKIPASSVDLQPIQIPPINKIPLQKKKTTFSNETNSNNNNSQVSTIKPSTTSMNIIYSQNNLKHELGKQNNWQVVSFILQHIIFTNSY